MALFFSIYGFSSMFVTELKQMMMAVFEGLKPIGNNDYRL